jgi:Protein of unknown function (DUF3048) N-terminal domain/Protein of unknown function (DUF3048) C-terminal domain
MHLPPRRIPFRRASLAVATAGLLVGTAGVASASPPDSTPPPTTAAATTAAPTTVAPSTTAAATTAAPTTAAPTTAAPTTAAPTTTAPAPVLYPLTGTPVPDPTTYTPRPALVVKIDNGVHSHPQSGINQADIVFEEIVEGRVTRFAAVFNSMDSDPVGNIRSGRTQDVDLFGGLNTPIFAYSGGNAGVNAALAGAGFVLLTQGDGMFRVDGRGGAPYNLFANTTDLYQRGIAGGAGDAVPMFAYAGAGDVAPTGTPATAIDLGIGSVSVHWDYDAEQGLYLRSQGGSPHETNTGQVSTNTLVVLLVPYQASAADSRSPEATTIGTGSMVVYMNGQKIEGSWERASRTDPFTFTDSNGAPLLIHPGRTFVELADAGSYSLSES